MKEAETTSVQLSRQEAASRVAGHIHQASKNTGISFSYLMAQAGKESDFQSNSASSASSAAGLYQFTKSTWMQLVKLHGAKHGLGEQADKIHKNSRGEYVTSDAASRQQILELRRDPKLSAMMAAEYAKDNKSWLERQLGRPVDSTDLYMAHFLGPGGAAKVLKARASDPSAAAADLVPQAAHKNPTVFYDNGHHAQSVAAVYDKIHNAIERPMRQYAKLEDNVAVTAPIASSAPASRKTVAGSGKADESWPFEQAHWPPAYVPPVNASQAKADPTIADTPDKISYTSQAQSADQISAPMPPRLGSAANQPYADPRPGLGQLLKGIFG